MIKKIVGIVGGLVLFLVGIHLWGWIGMYYEMAPWQIILTLTLIFSGLFINGFWLNTSLKWLIGWTLLLLGIILLCAWGPKISVWLFYAGVGCATLGALGTGFLFRRIISRKNS